MSNTQCSLSPSVLLSTLGSLRPSQTPTHVLHPPLWSCMAQTHLHMQENPHGFTYTHTYTQNVICVTAAVCALPTYRSCDSPRRNCDPGMLHCLKLSLLLSCARCLHSLFILKRRGASDKEQEGRKTQVKNAGMVLSYWLVVCVYEKLVTNALNIDRMHK